MGVGRHAKLQTEDELYQYAVGVLARRMRSVAELKRLLRRRVEAETKIGQVLVELVIRRLKDRGYLDDGTFATTYSRLRRENQKFGPKRVIADLKAKGVHGDVILTAINSTYAGINEERLAKQYLRRKRISKPRDNRQAGRVFGQLVRAGFSRTTTFKILRNWKLDEGFLEALENDSDP